MHIANMAPPGLLEIKEEPSLPNVENPTKFTNQTELSRFPAEIQQKVWVEAMQKPACHTFKVLQSKDDDGSGRWTVHLRSLPERSDPSAYRRWKSLLHCKAKDNTLHKDKIELKNIGFQTGFRLAMVNFQRILLKTLQGYQLAAAIDVETDLVILEFERGKTAPQFTWFEHSTTHMGLNIVRHRMRHFKRVAIHYKAGHASADKHGPFQCYCPPPIPLNCHKYKICCSELACFLDCFENLEEFYFVVEIKGKKNRKWAAAYKSK